MTRRNTVATDERGIVLNRRYAQAAETVFRAWTDAELLRRWYAPDDGWIVGRAEVQPGVGGSYVVTFGPPPRGDAYQERGTYTEFAPPSRLAWNGTLTGVVEEALRVEVTFAADGPETEMTLRETGVVFGNAVPTEHEEGWTSTLVHLDRLLDAR
jgi:uncharacterized protein YndB with AHSA1/START domain